MDEKEALRKEFELAKLTFEHLKGATLNSIEELAKDLKFAYHDIEKKKSEGIVYFLFCSILFAFYFAFYSPSIRTFILFPRLTINLFFLITITCTCALDN